MQIEHNVQIPPRANGGNVTKTLMQMAVGDSIVLPTTKLNSYRSICHHINYKTASRKISDTEHRLWRTA